MEKKDQALISCNMVINGIEDETITTSSALLQCLKVARLLDDEKAIIWFRYEHGGYPKNKDGHIESNAYKIASSHGRKFYKKEHQYIFTDLASELEGDIELKQIAISNFTTKGVSVSGDHAMIAMTNLTNSIVTSTRDLINMSSTDNKRLSILKLQYYDYALMKYIELSFSEIASNIFDGYRLMVEKGFSTLSKDVMLKMKAIEDSTESENPELYSQVLTTCRRLFEQVSCELYEYYFPEDKSTFHQTKSGKKIDVSGNHYKNKLSAVIEEMEDVSGHKCLIGNDVIYYIDWIDSLHELQCIGVHSTVSMADARRCIIQTYTCLGDILIIHNSILKK